MPVAIERRGDGVNWSIDHFPSLPEGCVPFMMNVLSGVMRDFELADADTVSATFRSPSGAGGPAPRKH